MQLKDEKNSDIKITEAESEYWHAKSLEIACVFLPSECPLLNHILLSYQKHHAPTQYTIPEDSEYTDNLTVIKPMTGMQSCKYNPIIRITPKPDPKIEAYPLAPLRQITDSLLGRLEENENDIKTIVTQSYKHTGQNSVVNLKDKDLEIRRESNQSSSRDNLNEIERLINDNSHSFEDAYDDSAILEDKVKQMHERSERKKSEEMKVQVEQEVEDVEEQNPTRPISNNNAEHLNPTIEQPSTVSRRQNVDASTNTIIISTDIDAMKEKADSVERREKPPITKHAATSPGQKVSPQVSKEMLIEDSVNSVFNDLEKDPQFLNDLSNLIGEKLVNSDNKIFENKNMSAQVTQKNEIIKSVITNYIKSCAISQNNTIDEIPKEDIEHFIQNS